MPLIVWGRAFAFVFVCTCACVLPGCGGCALRIGSVPVPVSL